MFFQHPETKEVFEVSDEHGEVLKRQGFYKVVEPKQEQVEQPRRGRGRPRKSEQ